MSVEVSGIDKEDERQTVENQLRMLIIHRRRVPFEVAHKNSTYPFVIPYFYYLAKSMGHTYHYWCSNCRYEDGQNWNSNFYVDIPKVHELLESLFSK